MGQVLEDCLEQLRWRLPMSKPSTNAIEAVTAMKSSHTANLPAKLQHGHNKLQPIKGLRASHMQEQTRGNIRMYSELSCLNQVKMAKDHGPARQLNLTACNLP